MLVLFVGVRVALDNQISPETLLRSDYRTINSLDIYAVEILEGIKSDNLAKTWLHISLDQKKTIIGDYTQLGWGIKCELPECRKSQLPTNGTFENVIYKYLPSEAFFLMSNGYDFNNTREIQKMKFDLIQDDFKNWPLGDWGVLGLAPDGDFLTYIRNTFGDFSFTFDFDHNTYSNSPSYKLNLYLNHEENQIISSHKLSVPNKWVLFGSLQDNEKIGEICFNYNECFYLSFKGASEFCQKEIKKACPENEPCTSLNINFHLSDSFKITIQNVDYVIYPNQYLRFSPEGELKCLMKDIPLKYADKSCLFELGLDFLKTHPPMYQIKNGIAYIAFLRFFDIKDSFRYTWPLFGVFSTLAIIIISLIISVNKKRAVTDEDNVYFDSN